MSGSSVARLRAALRESGTPLVSSLGDDGDDGAGAEFEYAVVAAAGPRASDHRADVEVAVAAVEEGYRLHYAEPLALRIGGDDDLRLLAGDRLYALGLARLAQIGDMTAIAALADVISLSAQAHAGDDDELARAAWRAAAAAIAGVRVGADAPQKATPAPPDFVS